MKIKYDIIEIKPRVFAVVVPDRYHRAMLFMRVQEYYESPNPKFRGKKSFNIWEYIEWYSRKNNDSFSYAAHWTGFNFPLGVALKCYDTLEDMYTPYDEIMTKIVWDIYEMNKDSAKAYIIGVADLTSITFQHELCHAYYHINKKYKKEVDAITESIEPKIYKRMCKNLTDMGYTEQVFYDEVQAYTCMDSDYFEFNRKISGGKLNKLSNKYKLIYEKYINKK